ncbi:hypothetical protein [Sphingopyxis sp. 113P3]|uniref:hypothetical protein n=1 Tax=Sphingopyxis sp. (strain 113P3) TaxID=292913 RepID=UPI0006AD43B0|nr:hypothetical protein [Sphingopyxis sp. 113P3]ALC11775.1 hypothetical protein LH20_07400 [Sphingopyxis sp. 113P3]
MKGRHDFAFQTGEWQVRHRKLVRRLAGCRRWYEFGGTCRGWEVLGGAGNVDDHWLDDPGGAYAAATVRRADPATGLWTIWWMDQRFPGLAAPLEGRFEKGIGTFFGVDELEGQPIVMRFIWSRICANSARWEQAFSADGGTSWETNWVMDFARA